MRVFYDLQIQKILYETSLFCLYIYILKIKNSKEKLKASICPRTIVGGGALQS